MDSERWQQVAQLYDAVLERVPDERTAFLAHASRGDDALRREIESLIAHDSTPVLIDEPMLETAAALLDEPSDLEPDALLGPYRIQRLVGRGGMGQVYRAIDTRLNRTVALKVLPRELANNPQFRARFDREAQAIAALAHPHVCTLHDVGRHDGIDFLVLEYLEGETLAARLAKGPLPFDQALTWATEISGALAAAHRLSIVHRDLKPGNIIVTTTGAKLLDFGLAKPAAPAVVHGDSPVPPTATPASSLTAQGTILGTVQYMAPEQLEGKEADVRTDIFAFGAVAYEMVTGKKAFNGNSQASLIGAIMHADPPALFAEQPLTPPALDRIIRTCLAKDPDDRWQSARDLWRELRAVRQAPGAIVASHKDRRWTVWVPAMLLGIALAGVTARLVTRQPPNVLAARFTVAAPAGTELPLARQPYSPSISPDGKRLVFQVVRNGAPLLAVRSLDALEAEILPGTERGRWPFWSPDSRNIAFFADGKLKRIDASGGPSATICDVPVGLGGDWNAQGVIVFLRGEIDGFYQVPATGGLPRAVVSVREGERLRSRPQFLPDGQRFLYSMNPQSVYLGSLADAPPRQVLTGTSMALYAPPGYLLFYQGTTLVAQRFSADLEKPVGEPIPVGEGTPGPVFGGGGLPFSVSRNGVMAYKTNPLQSTPDRVGWFDRTGRALDPIGPFPFETFGGVALSPDGSHLVMPSPRGPLAASEIWLFDLSRRSPTQFTFSEGSDRAPVWSPDGQRVVFTSLRRDAPGMYVKGVGGEQPEELLLQSGSTVWDEHWPTDWSSKGIVFMSGKDRESLDVWLLPVDGDRKPYPLVQEAGMQNDAKISPNGKWLAYSHRDTPLHRPEVHVRNLSNPGAKWRVSTAGGRSPYWRANGTELFYLATDGSLMSFPVEPDATSLSRGVPQVLFQTGFSVPDAEGPGLFFGASPDGRRFLLRSGDDQQTTASIVVVTNWPALLNR